VRYRGPAINLDFHRWLLRTKIFNTEGIDIAFVGREFGVECLEDLAAAEAIDPQSERFISNESYHSVMYLRVKDNRGKDRQIEVVFDTENFVCREVGAGAGRGKKRQKEAVASNSLKAAVDQLLEAIS
jgi:hypothetical protein